MSVSRANFNSPTFVLSMIKITSKPLLDKDVLEITMEASGSNDLLDLDLIHTALMSSNPIKSGYLTGEKLVFHVAGMSGLAKQMTKYIPSADETSIPKSE